MGTKAGMMGTKAGALVAVAVVAVAVAVAVAVVVVVVVVVVKMIKAAKAVSGRGRRGSSSLPTLWCIPKTRSIARWSMHWGSAKNWWTWGCSANGTNWM
jgi:hypothetical protein